MGILRLLALTLMAMLIARSALAAVASWYGPGFQGNSTANGEVYNQWAYAPYTAAHKSLPFGTRVRVRYGDRAVVVCINDRGPYVTGRDIDLNRAAAEALGIIGAGVANVSLTVLDRPAAGCG